MNKEKFIEELSKVTGLDNSQCIIINDIMEKHFIIGRKNKNKIISDLINELDFTNEKADNIYETVMSIISNGVKNKVKHPFKSQD